MNNKGVSMVTLVVTIIIIIVLASITVYSLYNTLSDATDKNIMEEMENLESVVGIASAKGLNGEFTPNDGYVITDSELEEKFGTVLTAEQMQIIKSINNDASADPLEKYYLLNQERIDSEFRNNDQVTVTGLKRDYLVSYAGRIIILNNNGKIISSGKIDSDESSSSGIRVAFTPNGNKNWARTQSATITVTGNNIVSTKYTWTESSSEPASLLIDKAFASGDAVSLTNETGNSWYIWVLVTYTEDGTQKQYAKRSEAFYIDNIPPKGELEVNSIFK